MIPSSLQASLGSLESSIKVDREVLLGHERVTSKKKYTVHEISDTGRLVREYVLPTGVVFAVTWEGASQPDLPLLLGTYFKEYERSATQVQHHRRHRSRTIRTENMVVVRSGHMRKVRGKAYLPKLIPEGMTPGELK
jgi:hypothetical protein